MYLFPVYVKESIIEGKGVFTFQKIKKGEVVWKYAPEHDQSISVEEYTKLSNEEKKYLEKVAYLSASSGKYIFPPENDPALYTNHDQKHHNLSVVVDKSISSEPYFIANRDIEVDEELTNNYNEFDAAIVMLKEKPDWLE